MSLPMQPIALDPSGRPRFVANEVVRFLLDWASARGMGLNELAVQDFPREHREQFSQLIGYSVSGFGDLSSSSQESIEAADRIAESLKNPNSDRMTTCAKCDFIRRSLLMRAAEVLCYQSWSSDFCTSRIRKATKELQERYPDLRDIQPCELSDDECDKLGFGRWEEGNPLRLIPLWLLPFLAEDIKTTCINGSPVLSRAEIDDDHRAGCLAYGIIPRDKKSKSVA